MVVRGGGIGFTPGAGGVHLGLLGKRGGGGFGVAPSPVLFQAAQAGPVFEGIALKGLDEKAVDRDERDGGEPGREEQHRRVRKAVDLGEGQCGPDDGIDVEGEPDGEQEHEGRE